MKKSHTVFAAALSAALLNAGCRDNGPLSSLTFDEEPDITPITSVLETAATVAYGATIATAVVSGADLPYVRSATLCPGYPCNALVYIDLDNAADLPFAGSASGEVMVASHWPSANVALMAIALLDVSVDGVTFDLSDVAMVPVLMTDSGMILAYVNQSVNLGYESVFSITVSGDETTVEFLGDTALAGEVGVSQSGWAITVDVQGTWDNPSDDDIHITGADQVAAASTTAPSALVRQVILTLVDFSASCRINPVSGVAAIGELGAGITPSDLSQALCVLTFQSSCDGTAVVTLATGSSLAWIGRAITLGLFE